MWQIFDDNNNNEKKKNNNNNNNNNNSEKNTIIINTYILNKTKQKNKLKRIFSVKTRGRNNPRH